MQSTQKPYLEAKVQWDVITAIHETDDTIVLMIEDIDGVIIPKHEFDGLDGLKGMVEHRINRKGARLRPAILPTARPQD